MILTHIDVEFVCEAYWSCFLELCLLMESDCICESKIHFFPMYILAVCLLSMNMVFYTTQFIIFGCLGFFVLCCCLRTK